MLDKELMRSALDEIGVLRKELLAAREGTDREHLRYQSLLNLKQYLILRSRDRMLLQEKLFMMSLSSLGRSYAHVAASIDTLYDQLDSSLHSKEIRAEEMNTFHHLSIQDAIATASQNSKALFGGKSSSKLSEQCTAVMVTLPSHAAENNGSLIHGLADIGVNVFRINTAHDSPETWRAMAAVIAVINKERKENEKIKIFTDLAGPKIRTGKIRRVDQRLAIGSNKYKKEILLYTDDAATKAQGTDPATLENIPAQISVNRKFFKKFREEKPIKIFGTNNEKAAISITELADNFAKALINRKIYIDKDTELRHRQHYGTVQNIEKQPDLIRLFAGDHLIITEKEIEGRSAVLDEHGMVLEPALISCSLKKIASYIEVGKKVFIDDGKIALVVVETLDESILCRVTHAKESGTLLKEEKGINFPDTHIKTSALTETDRKNMLEVLEFTDHLSISFCQDAEDIIDLQKLLAENGRSDIGIIAKIETMQAIINMPDIIKQLLEWEKSGVMIARGDLAIEVGFKNMAYMQEALLDICDAAHMPVIWATQVLESQMKSNLPSRAEVTDAAMSGRAECVMLNKGAFAANTISVLTHILDDMHSLFKKNRQLLKKETLWQESS